DRKHVGPGGRWRGWRRCTGMTESETARRSNELSCLVALRDAGELTITELMVATGLSRPTADRIARLLEEGGAIGSAIRPAQGAGRPAPGHRLTADARTAGLEPGRPPARAAVADRARVLIDTREIPRREPTSDADLESTAAVLDDLEGVIDAVVGDRE